MKDDQYSFIALNTYHIHSLEDQLYVFELSEVSKFIKMEMFDLTKVQDRCVYENILQKVSCILAYLSCNGYNFVPEIKVGLSVAWRSFLLNIQGKLTQENHIKRIDELIHFLQGAEQILVSYDTASSLVCEKFVDGDDTGMNYTVVYDTIRYITIPSQNMLLVLMMLMHLC